MGSINTGFSGNSEIPLVPPKSKNVKNAKKNPTFLFGEICSPNSYQIKISIWPRFDKRLRSLESKIQKLGFFAIFHNFGSHSLVYHFLSYRFAAFRQKSAFHGLNVFYYVYYLEKIAFVKFSIFSPCCLRCQIWSLMKTAQKCNYFVIDYKH